MNLASQQKKYLFTLVGGLVALSLGCYATESSLKGSMRETDAVDGYQFCRAIVDETGETVQISQFPTHWSLLGVKPRKVKKLILSNDISMWPINALEQFTNLEYIETYNPTSSMPHHQIIRLRADYPNAYVPTCIYPGHFSYNKKLKAIKLPSTVNFIETAAFTHCPELKQVDLSNCYSMRITEDLFREYTSLVSVILPSSLIDFKIEKNAFKNCTSLESINLPSSLRTIGGGAFCSCSGLKSISFPSSLARIGGGAFINCSGFTEIDLSNCNQLQTLGDDSTSGGTSLGFDRKDPSFVENPLHLCYSGTLAGCTNLSKVKFPPFLKNTGYKAFQGCKSLKSIEIPKSIEIISDKSFMESGLESITLPSSTLTIGCSAFSGCTDLVRADLSSCTGLNGIEEDAFCSCTNLTEIKLPHKLKSISEYAFYACTSLKEISLPESLIKIEERAFQNCSNLKTIIWEGDTSQVRVEEKVFPEGVKHYHYKGNQLVEFSPQFKA